MRLSRKSPHRVAAPPGPPDPAVSVRSTRGPRASGAQPARPPAPVQAATTALRPISTATGPWSGGLARQRPAATGPGSSRPSAAQASGPVIIAHHLHPVAPGLLAGRHRDLLPVGHPLFPPGRRTASAPNAPPPPAGCHRAQAPPPSARPSPSCRRWPGLHQGDHRGRLPRSTGRRGQSRARGACPPGQIRAAAAPATPVEEDHRIADGGNGEDQDPLGVVPPPPAAGQFPHYREQAPRGRSAWIHRHAIIAKTTLLNGIETQPASPCRRIRRFGPARPGR